MPVMTTSNHLNPHHPPWQAQSFTKAATSKQSGSASPSMNYDGFIQQARSRLRPVSSSARAERSSSSITSADSANSHETVTPDASSRRPIPTRSVTSPASPRLSEQANQGSFRRQFASGSEQARRNGNIAQTDNSTEEEDDEEDDDDYDEDEEDDDYDDDDEPISEEHVVALHDFTSNNSTCLSFSAGQIIKVFNRDESGWWDGELDGKRGWFPSNYVDEDGMAIGSPETASHDLAPEDPMASHRADSPAVGLTSRASRYESDAQGSSHSAPYTSANMREPPYSATRHAFPSNDHTRDAGIIEPIQHSIALLRNAVAAGRWPHFQPATACVISSVRSVLSATDCLTRESTTLQAHPILAKERKQVLSELSRLVTQSRRASAVGQNEDPVMHEMEMMLTYAQNVLNNTRRFLAVAVECGVNPADQSQDSPTLVGGPTSRADIDKTPTPGSPRSSYITARSSNGNPLSATLGSFGQNLATPRPGLAGLRHHQSEYHLPPRSPRSPGTGSGFYRSRTDSDASEADSGDSTSASGPRRDSSDDQDSEAVGAPVTQTRDQALERLKRANDYLLSIVAAFVGHIHTHTRGSHPSSYAFLIDVTREAVDSVRDLLVVVEGVHANPSLQGLCPNEMSILWETRESLYEATTTLVTAARIVTSKTLTSPESSPSLGGDDEEKNTLLASATTLLRTGQECVGAARMCLCRTRPDFVLVLATPSKASVAREARADARLSREEAEMDAEEERELQRALASGDTLALRRGKHTLSLLGRKATSLNCLRQRYEAMGADATTPAEEERHGSADSGYGSRSGSNSIIGSRKSSLAAGRKTNFSPTTTLDASNNRQNENLPSRPRAGTNGEASDSSDARSNHFSIESGLVSPSMITTSTDMTSNPSSDRRQASVASEQDPGAEAQASEKQVNGRSSQPHTPKSAGAPLSLEQQLMAPMYDPTDICYNADGQVTGATLPALVEKMTPHDTTVDTSFSNSFFLCFRLFTNPQELFDALLRRFTIETPAEVENNPDALNTWTNNKVMPIRLRVLNVFKIWLEIHWQPSTDRVILEPLLDFISTSMTHSLARSGQRLAELAQSRLKIQNAKVTVIQGGTIRGPGSLKRVFSADKLKGSLAAQGFIDVDAMNFATSFPKGAPLPTPLVSKSLASMLRNNPGNVNVLDVDPLELARQLTIMESKLFCCILPEELLGQEFSKKTGQSNAVHVKKMSALTTHITGWIAECILGEDDVKKRTQLVRYFIKVGDRCMTISNYNALFAIQSALNTSTITRLRKTWDGVSTKYLNMMEAQRTVIEHTKNFAVYRSRLRSAALPALPFVGLFLTDLTFCHEGNANTRPSPLARNKQLINFDKYMKLSRIVSDLQKFQVPFNLVEVVEIQSFLHAVLTKGSQASGPEELYNRSLALEPRKREDAGGSLMSLAGSSAGVGSGILSNGSGGANGSGGGTLNGSAGGGASAGTPSTISGASSSGKSGSSGLDIFNWK